MLKIQQRYVTATGRKEFTLAELGEWAIRKKLYEPPIEHSIKHFCEQMRRVLQNETHVDRDGQTIRTWQCAKRSIANADGQPGQGYLWADMRTAEPNFVLSAFAERFRAARADARKVQADVHSWNKFHRPKSFPAIEFDWDFSGEQGDEAPGDVA